MSIVWVWLQRLGLTAIGVTSVSTNLVSAEVIPDNTLPTNSQVTRQGNTSIIEGGSQAGNNLFHSFKEFTLLNNSQAEFRNSSDVRNIITRITGESASTIDGILKAQGTANIFLINPNGIIFGSNATLDIGGSLIASTASSLNFADGNKFSATDTQNKNLLTASVPIGLEFGGSAALIRNYSQANPNRANNRVGLQVQPNNTLALIGGDVILEGGNITAISGRVELGSVGANSLVSLKPTTQGWFLGYEGVQNFQNIRLIQRTVNNTNIASQVNANNVNGSAGNIQVQANTVELTGIGVRLLTQARATEDGGNITINARKLILRDGAEISTVTRGQGDGGKLTVNASESVEVIGAFTNPNNGATISSGLFSSTAVAGKAGDITINTRRLLLQDGGQIATDSLASLQNSELIPGIGAGGNLTVNATESVELVGTSTNRNVTSGLFASTTTSGNAGKVTISTGKLIIRDDAEITVSSELSPIYTYPKNGYKLGNAGEINVTARSIVLEDKGKLTSNSDAGMGGDINLQVQDLLLMRRESIISTNAGSLQTPGDGGNITINVPQGFIVAVPEENSDITANAFAGTGGKITINAKRIFGFVPRSRTDLVRLLGEDPDKLDPNNLPTNDITAFSQQNPSLSGTVQINTPDVDPSKSLVELPTNIVDASEQIASNCNSRINTEISSFLVIGRGGITLSPTDTLMDDAVLADWIKLPEDTENRSSNMQQYREEYTGKLAAGDRPSKIVEAQGWVVDANGKVVLVAQAPTVPHSSGLNSPVCDGLGSR